MISNEQFLNDYSTVVIIILGYCQYIRSFSNVKFWSLLQRAHYIISLMFTVLYMFIRYLSCNFHIYCSSQIVIKV